MNFNTPKTQRLFAEAGEQLLDLADHLERGETIETATVYDVGPNCFGECVKCGAWPGERHDLIEDEDCPSDTGHADPFLGADLFLGAQFSGAWQPSELPAVAEVVAALNDLAAAADMLLDPPDSGRQLTPALLRLYAARLVQHGRAPIVCRCGSKLLGGIVCTSDPTPPRCDRCRAALSHGTCRVCQPEAWREATTPTAPDALVVKGGAL